MVMKAHQALNFMRSAIAPRISAGVMIANMPWNMMKMYSGMLRGGEAKFAVTESSVTPDEPDLREVADERVAGAEGEAVADQDPEHADDAGGQHALHEDVQHVLGAHQAAVEEGEARQRHHQDQGRRGQHPGGVAAVDHRRRVFGERERARQQGQGRGADGGAERGRT